MIKQVKYVKPVIWSLVVSSVCMGTLAWAGIWYTGYVDDQAKARTEAAIRESDQKWCDILLLFDNTYKEQPPTMPTGQKLAVYMHNLVIAYRCEERK